MRYLQHVPLLVGAVVLLLFHIHVSISRPGFGFRTRWVKRQGALALYLAAIAGVIVQTPAAAERKRLEAKVEAKGF